MTYLERLKPLAEVGAFIPCPQMTLLAGDHEPALVTGAGEIMVRSTTRFGYRIAGMPADIGHALRTLGRLRRDPYDGRRRERLVAVTQDGASLHCGWTIPAVDPDGPDGSWIFTGVFEALTLDEPGLPQRFTDVTYLLARDHLARIVLRRFFPAPGPDGRSVHRLQVLGTELCFTLHDESDLLQIHAPASDLLPLTYTENWLGEPLRILFGQLIYPRFVARGTGSHVINWIRPSPPWSHQADPCALWQGDRALTDRAGFWDSYARLLAYIAGARDFEANTITDFYVEVIRASRGSRWVWALGYASAVEGLVNLIFPRGSRRADMDAAEIAGLEAQIAGFKEHIDRWTGDPRLKAPAKAAASRMLETSAAIGLRRLRDTGWVTADQYKAWDRLRNDVMHGTLVSPYSSAEDDKLLLDLAHLLHALTRRIIAGVDPATGCALLPSAPVHRP